jgi:hypothetical protein
VVSLLCNSSLQVGEVARSFYTLARRVKDSEPKGLTKHFD